MPASASIRAARTDDYEAIVELYGELRVDGDPPQRDRWVENVRPFTNVATLGDRVVGYCYCQEYEDFGYIRHVVTSPQARGRGVGRQLMQRLAEHLHELGKRSWCLNVRPDNAAARALYERMGMRIAYSSSALRLPWSRADRIEQNDSDIIQLPPEADAAVEDCFGLPRHQLAEARALGNRILVARGPAGPRALAVLDPSFPGAFPFRLHDHAVLGSLLAAMREFVRSEDEQVGMVVEDDAELVAILLGHGAELRDEVVHMRGTIPEVDGA